MSKIDAEHKEAMRQSDLFRTLSDEEIGRVADLCEQRSYPADGAIINEDERGTEIFVVVKGRVDIEIRRPLGGDASQTIDTLGPGHVFGELTLVDGFLRSATVRARGPVECLVIPDGKLISLMDADHTIGYRIMRNVSQVLSARIRETNLRLRNALADVIF